ncbi:hypothetical protein [Nocardia sp. XZ_19_369]|uniref:hypothetical protein n=1 Tax=Nocardia sp. XZ_19_369 TaxID=2769487 RepID=UPI00188F7CF4|nr:hypothetical protein [Nocardia sp. XZ_19_369]
MSPDPEYILTIVPTQQGYAKYPNWRLGGSVAVKDSDDLQRRKAAADKCITTGDISSYTIKKYRDLEEQQLTERLRQLALQAETTADTSCRP